MSATLFTLTQLRPFFHVSILSCAILAAACASAPQPEETAADPSPVEMHIWIPPSQEELDLRKARQQALDDVEDDMQLLAMKQQGLNRQTLALQHAMSFTAVRTSEIEAQFREKMASEAAKSKQLKQEIAFLQASQELLKKRLKQAYYVPPPPPRFTQADYNRAIGLLKDGQYKRSIKKFNQLLLRKPPRSLKDNLHFGLGTAYYKLRKYSEAVRQWNTIVKNHPRGDKFFMSHVMLGMVYDLKGEKSRALYILDEALKHGPPDSVRTLIEQMRNKIENANAAG